MADRHDITPAEMADRALTMSRSMGCNCEPSITVSNVGTMAEQGEDAAAVESFTGAAPDADDPVFAVDVRHQNRCPLSRANRMPQ